MSKIAGRGAVGNEVSKRFNLPERETDGDWLDQQQYVDGLQPKPRTTVGVITPRTIVTHNQSPDIPFDRSINPYVGCEHGCIYCYARPTHAWHDLSPGLDFETKLFAKPQAPELLRLALQKPGYACQPIAFGTNTDPYQPIEGKWQIMRRCIEVLAEARHPLTITTKSDRVVRDLDLLAPMAEQGLAAVMISVTTLDPQVARTLEPRAAHPARRLDAVAKLSAAGIPTYVALAPVIPAITDHEIEGIMERAAQAGAIGCITLPIRLPHEVAPLFRQWLDTDYPDRAAKVMSIIQSLRGGRDNDANFHSRFRGEGAWAQLIHTRFRIAAKRFGLDGEAPRLRRDLFRPPPGDQGELF